MGLGEMYRSWNKKAFVTALQALLPELKMEDVSPGGSGVRAQALDRNGKLLDDFSIVETPRVIHVLNAPSPAATESIVIGEAITGMVLDKFQL
jgi:L-2-hydroxyglutarate oxidase